MAKGWAPPEKGWVLLGKPLVLSGKPSAFTLSKLTEVTLDGSVVALTLNGGTYALSRIDIGEAIKASGVPGVAVKWFDIDRLSDTTETVELEFNGDIMEADGTLTFSVGVGAIASYNGPALSAQLPVTASKEDMLAVNFPNPFNPET